MKRRTTMLSKMALVCIALLLALATLGVAYAPWTDDFHIEQRITTGYWDLGGSMGFWRTWWAHYSEGDMLPWLETTNDASRWLGPTTVQGLNDLFAEAAGRGSTPKSRFLGHYMATRLSIAAGRLDPANTHDITGIPGHAYLGLPNPTSATLSAIVIAIEGKHPADPGDPGACWPDNRQYEILKDICDAINSLQT